MPLPSHRPKTSKLLAQQRAKPFFCAEQTSMNDQGLDQLFADRNRETQQNWSAFESHRQRLRQLLDGEAPSGADSLCVLGAGNLNDLDLPWLAGRFAEITLVDVDRPAMEAGAQRQLGSARPPGVMLVQCEVTGAFDLLGRLSQQASPASDEDIIALQQRLATRPAVEALGRKYDCVVSACLLSQLIDAVKKAVGEDHPQFVTLVQGLRHQHLATLLDLTAPQGVVLLVFDFVSSVTCPELDQIPEPQLGSYAAAQIARRNFFTGLNPAVVLQALQQQRPDSGFSGAPRLTSPWRWNLGPRTYLVAAAVARTA